MRFLIAVVLSAIFLTTTAAAQNLERKGKIATLYLQHCASCHGKQMQGGMADSLLNDKWTTDGSDAALAAAISSGIKDAGMPAWNKVLDPDNIRAMVILIREQRNQAASSKLKAPDTTKPFKTEHYHVKLDVVGQGTNHLWGLDFLADESLLVTQKDGTLWHFKDGQRTKITGTPDVWHYQQGGLLDVFVHPDDKAKKKEHPWIYLSFAEKISDRILFNDKVGATTIVRGKIKNNAWVDQQILFQQDEDKRDNRGIHFGSRFAYHNGYIFFSLGEENQPMQAQSLSALNGKIHRIHDDGRIPKDNPFVKKKGAMKSIWSYGHRNPQGLDTHPVTGELWNAEHGPRGGDEINLVIKGKNYGWPLVTYGMDYDGSPISAKTQAPGIEAPKYYWVPSIAPCGMEFYEGNVFRQWQNNIFVAALAGQRLVRLQLDNNKVVREEVIFQGLGRVRDIASGPDGNLYVIINNSTRDAVYRLSLAEPKTKKTGKQ